MRMCIFSSKCSLDAFQINMGLLLVLVHDCKLHHLTFSVNRFYFGKQSVLILKEVTTGFQDVINNLLGFACAILIAISQQKLFSKSHERCVHKKIALHQTQKSSPRVAFKYLACLQKLPI